MRIGVSKEELSQKILELDESSVKELCALPDVIYHAYRSVLPKPRTNINSIENAHIDEGIVQDLADEYDYKTNYCNE